MSRLISTVGKNKVLHVLDPDDPERKRRFVIETNFEEPREVEVKTFKGDKLEDVSHYPIDVFIRLMAEVVREYRLRRLDLMSPNMLVGLPEFEDVEGWYG